METLDKIKEYINTHFSESLSLSAILAGKSMNKEKLVASIIDMEHCTREHADKILADALASGYVVLENNKYQLNKTVNEWSTINIF